jgi:hypothetical protein
MKNWPMKYETENGVNKGYVCGLQLRLKIDAFCSCFHLQIILKS